MSIYNSDLDTGSTLVFDETPEIEQFIGFYDFYTNAFVPYVEGYLSVNELQGADSLFLHNSRLKDKCCFYSAIPAIGDAETSVPNDQESKYVESTVKVLFNDDYGVTKVFDNLNFLSTVTKDDIEVYNDTFSSIRCYNNYQNTDYCTLTYGINLERDEREWSTFVPRNAVNRLYTSNPDVFDPINIDSERTFRERSIDKYMITDFTYTNTSNRRIIIPYIEIKYRISYR
jgi:hypothetical protein